MIIANIQLNKQVTSLACGLVTVWSQYKATTLSFIKCSQSLTTVIFVEQLCQLLLLFSRVGTQNYQTGMDWFGARKLSIVLNAFTCEASLIKLY